MIEYYMEHLEVRNGVICKSMKPTDELLKQLQNLNIDEFKNEDMFDDITIADYLNELLKSHNLLAKDIIINLNMERSYTYQILNGRRNPTRFFLLRLGLFMHLSLDEIQKMLSVGRRPVLYPRNRFDAAVIFAIQHDMSLEELNALLEDIGEPPLS